MSIRLAPIGLALIVFTAACGDSTAPNDEVVIEMRDNSFSPSERTVSVGTTVRWRNVGEFPHNSTSTTSAWTSGDIQPNASFSRSFDTAGTFDYECTLHAGMTGRIIVQ